MKYSGNQKNDLAASIAEMVIRDLIVNHWTKNGFPQISVSESEGEFEAWLTLDGEKSGPIKFSKKEALAVVSEFRSHHLGALQTVPNSNIQRRMKDIQDCLITFGK